MKASSFEIKGRANARSLFRAAALSVLGMILMGLVAIFRWDANVALVGMAIAGVGIGLVLVSQDAARKSSVVAMLDDNGFQLASSRTKFGLPWTDVKRVSMAGNELIIRDYKGQEVKVVAPPGSQPGELNDLAVAMAARLDASRGYRTGDHA